MNTVNSMQNFIETSKTGAPFSLQMQPSPAPLKNSAKVSDTIKLNNEPKRDEFVKSSPQKKKTSLKKKILITLGITAAAIAGIGALALFTRTPVKKFASHVDFTKASTMDEAIEFAQKNFGIKTFDFGDDLEFANWVNEGLTNINNRYKGRAYMPKVIGFGNTKKEKSGKTIMGFAKDLDNEIRFNKSAFDRKALYKDFMSACDKVFHYDKKTGQIMARIPRTMSRSKFLELAPVWDKLKKNPKAFSRFELVSYHMKLEDATSIYMDPKSAMYMLLNNKSAMKKIKKAGLKLDPDEFLKLSKKKQISFIEEIFRKANLNLTGGTTRSNSKFDILYHEMGHLEHANSTTLFDNLFGIISGRKKALEKFTNNLEEQRIAGKISWYAQTSPKEFVAETFNVLMAGKKPSREVMELYRKYKGPIPPSA